MPATLRLAVAHAHPHGPAPLDRPIEDGPVGIRQVIELAPRQIPYAVQPRVLENLADQGPVAAHKEADAPGVPEDPHEVIPHSPHEFVGLVAAPTGEALLTPPARSGAGLHVPGADLVRDESRLRDECHGIPTATDQEHRERRGVKPIDRTDALRAIGIGSLEAR